MYDVPLLMSLGTLKVFANKPRILKLRDTISQDFRFQRWMTDTEELFQRDFVRAHKMVCFVPKSGDGI